MYTPGQSFGGTNPGFSPNTVRSTTCSLISITPDQGTVCTLRHVYIVFLMNEELYALGVVANTVMMLAVPSVQVRNQRVILPHRSNWFR